MKYFIVYGTEYETIMCEEVDSSEEVLDWIRGNSYYSKIRVIKGSELSLRSQTVYTLVEE